MTCGTLFLSPEVLDVKDYKKNYKERIENEEIRYPEGTELSGGSDEEEQEEVTENKPSKQLKTDEDDDTKYASIITKNSAQGEKKGWLANSGLSEEQQMKLFRLMGGKSKEDLELLNNRAATYDYNKVSKLAEADFSQGIKKRMGNQLKGLGKR